MRSRLKRRAARFQARGGSVRCQTEPNKCGSDWIPRPPRVLDTRKHYSPPARISTPLSGTWPASPACTNNHHLRISDHTKDVPARAQERSRAHIRMSGPLSTPTHSHPLLAEQATGRRSRHTPRSPSTHPSSPTNYFTLRSHLEKSAEEATRDTHANWDGSVRGYGNKGKRKSM